MDRSSRITGRSFSVRIYSNGRDITAKSPLRSVRYEADGTGTRTLADGSTTAGRWRFVDGNPARIDVEGPEGLSRWVIVELGDAIYRKVNIDTGVEFVHEPQRP